MVDIRVLKDAAAAHRVEIIEGGVEVLRDGEPVEPMPGYCQMRCSCGWTARTYWGRGHAEETGKRHVFSAVTEQVLTPGGANAEPRR